MQPWWEVGPGCRARLGGGAGRAGGRGDRGMLSTGDECGERPWLWGGCCLDGTPRTRRAQCKVVVSRLWRLKPGIQVPAGWVLAGTLSPACGWPFLCVHTFLVSPL